MKRRLRNYIRRIKKFLTRKHGPLAVWAWIAVAVVGVLVYRRRKSGQGWPWQSATQQAGDVGMTDPNTGAATSPSTPPDLSYVPGGAIPVDMGGGLPSSGGDMAGLLAILNRILGRNHKRHHKHHKHHHHHGDYKHHHHKKHRHRSHAHHRNNMGGRHHRDPTGGAPVGRPHHHRGNGKSQATPDPRVTRPMVGDQQQTARPMPSHAPHREPVKSPPRPSSPPKRTVRARKGK